MAKERWRFYLVINELKPTMPDFVWPVFDSYPGYQTKRQDRNMTGLEQSFYIIGIVFMSVMLILVATLVTAVLVVRNKVVSLEKTVEEKLNHAAKPMNKVVEIANAVREVARAAK